MTTEPEPMWPMYRAMVGVGLLCAVAVVGAYEGTRSTIAANEAEARQAAVLRVVPGATRSVAYVAGPDGTFAPGTAEGDVVYAALADDGTLAGLAFEGHGIGYQDTIDLLVGYRLDTRTLSGLTVTRSRETPGLGDRIETDLKFLAGFDGLDVSLTPDGTALAHPIAVDTISGATVSSSAVVDIVADASATWVPRLAARRDDFAGGEP